MGRAGIGWYTKLSLWSRCLCSNVSRLGSVSKVVTDPGCLERYSQVMT